MTPEQAAERVVGNDPINPTQIAMRAVASEAVRVAMPDYERLRALNAELVAMLWDLVDEDGFPSEDRWIKAKELIAKAGRLMSAAGG